MRAALRSRQGALIGQLTGLVWAFVGAMLRASVVLAAAVLFSMPYVLSGRTVAVAALGVGLVLLVAQWPALRQIARLNLAEAVRAREG